MDQIWSKFYHICPSLTIFVILWHLLVLFRNWLTLINIDLMQPILANLNQIWSLWTILAMFWVSEEEWKSLHYLCHKGAVLRRDLNIQMLVIENWNHGWDHLPIFFIVDFLLFCIFHWRDNKGSLLWTIVLHSRITTK